jgi:hypothetical protein
MAELMTTKNGVLFQDALDTVALRSKRMEPLLSYGHRSPHQGEDIANINSKLETVATRINGLLKNCQDEALKFLKEEFPGSSMPALDDCTTLQATNVSSVATPQTCIGAPAPGGSLIAERSNASPASPALGATMVSQLDAKDNTPHASIEKVLINHAHSVNDDASYKSIETATMDPKDCINYIVPQAIIPSENLLVNPEHGGEEGIASTGPNAAQAEHNGNDNNRCDLFTRLIMKPEHEARDDSPFDAIDLDGKFLPLPPLMELPEPPEFPSHWANDYYASARMPPCEPVKVNPMHDTKIWEL